MKSVFNRSVLACAAILAVVGITQASAQQKPLKSYQSGNKEFWTHPPDDWFLGDENEAQKGLAPPSGPPTGSRLTPTSGSGRAVPPGPRGSNHRRDQDRIAAVQSGRLADDREPF